MLKNISKIFIAGSAIVALQPLYSMEIYTVKSGDYLYKIAKSHTVSGISTGELTDSIKGINKSEVPGIVDNRISVGDKLAIPTTKGEVEDGLTLARNEMVQGTYSANVSQTPKVIESNNSPNLGDRAMISNQASTAPVPQITSPQNTVPSMMPNDDARVVTYSNDLGSKINSQDTQEVQSNDINDESDSVFSKLFKFVFIIIVLLGLFILGKRFWDNRNTKKEHELEIISKKRRDHLMSRISPVVSGSDFYKAEDNHQSSKEAFDFSAPLNDRRHSEVTTEYRKLDEDDNQQNNIEGQDIKIESLDVLDATLNDDLEDANVSIEENNASLDFKSSAIKTSKGMVFETACESNFAKADSLVEEVDTGVYEGDEIRYVEELVEQYLESERFEEAIITVQDSLETSPNNIDLRFMLLEIYARMGEQIAFDGEVHFIKSKNIVSMFDPLHQKIAKLKDKYFE